MLLVIISKLSLNIRSYYLISVLDQTLKLRLFSIITIHTASTGPLRSFHCVCSRQDTNSIHRALEGRKVYLPISRFFQREITFHRNHNYGKLETVTAKIFYRLLQLMAQNGSSQHRFQIFLNHSFLTGKGNT